ncbi:MAG: sulfurtransferase TusA family protein [Burkholderiales bacterium]|nr:sulfurtransferase TusA family protein [Burkholderiales bacterium]
MSATVWWRRILGREPRQAAPSQEVVLPGAGPTRIAHSVDCLGASCPRPQLLAMKVMSRMADGEVVEVHCDSAAAVESFPALALTLVSTHLATVRDGYAWRVYLRKGL